MAEALGGAADLPAISISATGATSVGYEGLRPDDGVDTGRDETEYVLDLSAGRVRASARAEPLFESFETSPPREFTVVVGEHHGVLAGDARVAGEDERETLVGEYQIGSDCRATVSYIDGPTLVQYVAPDGSDFYWIQTDGFEGDHGDLFGGREHRVSTSVDPLLTNP